MNGEKEKLANLLLNYFCDTEPDKVGEIIRESIPLLKKYSTAEGVYEEVKLKHFIELLRAEAKEEIELEDGVKFFKL